MSRRVLDRTRASDEAGQLHTLYCLGTHAASRARAEVWCGAVRCVVLTPPRPPPLPGGTLDGRAINATAMCACAVCVLCVCALCACAPPHRRAGTGRTGVSSGLPSKQSPIAWMDGTLDVSDSTPTDSLPRTLPDRASCSHAEAHRHTTPRAHITTPPHARTQPHSRPSHSTAGGTEHAGVVHAHSVRSRRGTVAGAGTTLLRKARGCTAAKGEGKTRGKATQGPRAASAPSRPPPPDQGAW
jgi:hypothetical protein